MALRLYGRAPTWAVLDISYREIMQKETLFSKLGREMKINVDNGVLRETKI